LETVAVDYASGYDLDADIVGYWHWYIAVVVGFVGVVGVVVGVVGVV